MMRSFEKLSEVDYYILSSVEVPQANDLSKIFEVGIAVASGVIEVSQIAAHLGIVDREGAYYADAACAIRIIRKRQSFEGQFYDVTGWAEEYANGSNQDRLRLIHSRTLDAPHLKYVALCLGEAVPLTTPTPPTLKDAESVVKVLPSLADLSPATARRRAACLSSWCTQLDTIASRLT
jgi:hypothetical protein